MDNLLSMRVFRVVAEVRSFATAARRLDISPAMASKHIIHLEQRLGTRLLNRTSRHVSLTEMGALYLDQVRQMLDDLDEVEATLCNAAVKAQGTLRLSAPVWMANPVFTDLLVQYHARHPDVLLDVDLSGRLVNLVEDGFDLALRVSQTLDVGLVARRVAEVRFELLGSPDYLDRAGRPARVEQLSGHPLLIYNALPSSGLLHLSIEGKSQAIQFQPMLRTGNEHLLHLCCLRGMGLTFLPGWMAHGDIAAGRLERVMPDLTTIASTLYGVYPSRKYLSAKVRSFLDFISQNFRVAE